MNMIETGKRIKVLAPAAYECNNLRQKFVSEDILNKLTP